MRQNQPISWGMMVHLFLVDAKQLRHQKTWSNHAFDARIAMMLLVKKMVKKRRRHRKSHPSNKKVRYDKSMAPGLTYLIFSWQRRPSSWLKMLTSSWYHMIDVGFFWFFFNRETAPHHQKKQEKTVLTPLQERIFFVIAKKIFCVSLHTKILRM